MDLFDLLLHCGLITAVLVGYLLIKNSPRMKGNYAQPGWNYFLKLPCAYFFVKKWKKRRPMVVIDELPRKNSLDGTDEILLQTSSPDGTTVVVGMRKLCCAQAIAEVTVYVKLRDGTEYFLPRHPDPVVGKWQNSTDGWRCSGLVIQVLEVHKRLRILYDGELKRMSDGQLQHVKFNFIWGAASRALHHPQDWSERLAARALVLQTWHGDSWENELNKVSEPITSHFGAAQGRVQTRDDSGNLVYDEYVRTRGVCARKISSKIPRREVTLTVCASDGTAVEFHAFSHPGKFTEGYSGYVRLPNFTSWPITSTDLMMFDFCETPDSIPQVYTLHVGTSERQLKLVLRINHDGGRVYSGIPYLQEVHYRTVHVDINGYIGTGVLQLCYETARSGPILPAIGLIPSLRWLSDNEVGPVSYCAGFDSKVAMCPSIVGGKGASLALLASKQELGYKVPPGFCVTYLALEKHLESNPRIVAAINELKTSNENYDESVFKQRCEKVVELFKASKIDDDIKDEVVSHLEELEKASIEQNYGPDVVYAVRSSAVGEDSEALSAAGQNTTILGCRKSAVIDAVRDCWASMYAFHSVYYRRRNGQLCECRGSVTVQTMVQADTAGVMFTRHDTPAKLLIAANYGLGETVVSGSAEPDTIIIQRDPLSIHKMEVGGKAQRVVTSQNGVVTVDVPADRRQTACLTDEQILELAEIGILQEYMWSAPRDIEWGILNGEIYLLQARPLTSLETWTEEELLHELDLPIMSEDELLTFANTGEVMPNPMSVLSHDMVVIPLATGVNRLVGSQKNEDTNQSLVTTHHRVCFPLYNSVYKEVPDKIDMVIRIMELSIHGRMVADDHILSVAKHRRKPHLKDKLKLFTMGRLMFTSKWWANNCESKVSGFDPSTTSEDISEILDKVVRVETIEDIECLCTCHSATTTASVMGQIIAMSILLEGHAEFTSDKCAEINTLLSCGDVVSAEVPQALANISRMLEASGKYQQFRELDPMQAMGWLKDNLPNVRNEVDKFLEQHGHRGIMEFDLSTKPWSLVPEQMIQVLQAMTLHENEEFKQKSIREIVAALKTPQKPLTRKILTWFLPLCQRLVRQREHTKANLILGVHKLRLAVLALGTEMVKQWYLPQKDLVFHFRLHELVEFVKTRDPALLRKATQRQQYITSWSKLKFAELQYGWPKPEEVKTIKYAADASVQGTGVCGGDVVARACVLTDLADIGSLQRGDILITRSTDIGWSPYFPLLGGVVTELGGLISHGAVIAREYGLPCVVGATDATSIFLTGDTIRLSATKGLIERVQVKD